MAFFQIQLTQLCFAYFWVVVVFSENRYIGHFKSIRLLKSQNLVNIPPILGEIAKPCLRNATVLKFVHDHLLKKASLKVYTKYDYFKVKNWGKLFLYRLCKNAE